MTLAEHGTGSTSAVTGRLAPSPTGLLHLGHARTFLIAWWHARSRGGRIGLRIEDLDGPRVQARFADAARRDLEWLGLDWDGAPSLQSAHPERFESAVSRLLSQGDAYPCICSRSDLASAHTAPHAGDREPRYPGTCKGRFASVADAERTSGRSAGVRLAVPAGTVTIEDDVSGVYTADVQAEVGDFLIGRRSGAPAYQLAVVVDDAAEGVTEVVRGDDLLASAVRQWHVQRALGLSHPRWAHVPLVTNEHGRRLAKHANDLALAELRERGVDPRAVVRWAAGSCGLASEGLVTARELTPAFRLERVPRTPVRVNTELGAALLPNG
ncbi:MAG TPA: tRNA glutamyl-Q(34) synthetase GluQRS [Polyangiaceae bacterium]